MTTAVADKLYPFQAKAVERMNDLPHVFLFDEMGLGKSVQALEHIQRNSLKPCLILCPKTLVWNWYEEIIKWYPDEVPVMFHNTDQFVDSYTDNKRRFFITWHDVLARFERDEVLAVLPHLNWKAIIVDEAHLFRNWGTIRCESLLQFKKGKKLILTGTPIVNSAMDLYPLVKLVGIDIYPRDFMQDFTYIRHSQWGNKPVGFRNRARFDEMLGDIWIRRTKAQVLKDLPPKTLQKLILEMPPTQRDAYNRMVNLLLLELDSGESLEAPEILALLTRLRQIALDPRIIGRTADSAKTQAIKELFHNHDGKIVVYSNFEQYISLLSDELRRDGIYTVRLTGKEDERQRRDAVRSFQDNPSVRGLLATMQTGGLGLNLTAASVAIIADQWWNKVRMNQAIDRSHRIGQVNKLLAVILHCRESIDDHIEEIVEGKDATARDVIEAIRERGY